MEPEELEQARALRTSNPRGIETRITPISLLLRAADDEDGEAEPSGFSGYASTFWDVDWYGTAFKPGAWSKSIKERGDKVKILWQHFPEYPIGKPTLLEEDDTGLRTEGKITKGTRFGMEALALLADEVNLGLSVGFKTITERALTEDDPIILDNAPEWVKRNPEYVWIIEEAALWEYSVVTFPANEMAEIDGLKSIRAAEALSTVLTELRSNRLPEGHRRIVEEIVAAFQGPAGGKRSSTTSGSAPASSSKRRADAALALAKARSY